MSQLSAATDGSLTSVNEKDIKAGAQKLADGTQQLVQVLGTEASSGCDAAGDKYDRDGKGAH